MRDECLERVYKEEIERVNDITISDQLFEHAIRVISARVAYPEYRLVRNVLYLDQLRAWFEGYRYGFVKRSSNAVDRNS